jgi:hypothetical protein
MTAHAPVMTAEEFVEYLRQFVENGEDLARAVDVRDITVNGSVDLNASKFVLERRLYLERVRFCDDVILGNCKFGNSVTLRSCNFDHALNLGKTTFSNGLSFTGCIFGGKDKKHDRLAITLDDASIRGDLTFVKATVSGCISARRLKVAGDLKFSGCTVIGQSAQNRAALDISNSKINGSVIFEAGEFSAPTTPSAVEPPGHAAAPKSRLPRSLFRDKRPGGSSIMLRGTDVTDLVDLAWARFEGELDLSFIKCRGLNSDAAIFVCRKDEGESPASGANQKSIAAGESFGGARVDGRITLSGGEFGLIHLSGITLSGEIMLIAGRSGQIKLEDSLFDGIEGERFIATSEIGNFIMSRWRCRDFLFLHAAKISGATNASRVRGITIISSVINRAVSFWPGLDLQRDLQGYLDGETNKTTSQKVFAIRPDGSVAEAKTDRYCNDLLNRWRRRQVIRGNISIDHCSIGDDVIMTAVDLTSGTGEADGRIEIVDTKIDGNVIFRTPVSFLADAQFEAPLLWLLAQRFVVGKRANRSPQGQMQPGPSGGDQDISFAPASCRVLDMYGVRADEVDLTGLYIPEPIVHSGDESTEGTPGQKAGVNASNPAKTVPPGSPTDRRVNTSASAVMRHLTAHGKVATFARLAATAANPRLAATTVKGIYAIQKSIWEAVGDKTDKEEQAVETERRKRERHVLTMCFGDQAESISEPHGRLEVSAHIPGALDFQHAVIGELLISDASFSEHSPEKRAADNGIVLDHAQISKLYVARSDLHNPRLPEHNGFPVPVSLLDLSVKTWFLEEEDVFDAADEAYIFEETKTADPYLDLLENDPAFRMSSYLAIETSLRDRGLTDEAKQIFVAGNYRDVRTESEKIRSTTDSRPSEFWTTLWPKLKWKIRPNWKIWRRGEGRYRRPTKVDIPHLLERREYSVWFQCLIWVVATLGAAALFHVQPSLIGFAYVALALLSCFSLLRENISSSRAWSEYLFSALWITWSILLVYALAEFTTQLSLVNFGYLLVIALCSVTLSNAFGLKPPQKEHLVLVEYAICFTGAVFAVAELLISSSLLGLIFLLVVLFAFFTLRGNVLRLQRPRREYLGFLLCIIWCALAFYFSVDAVTGPSLWSVGVLAVLLLFLFPLFAAMRCFIDQLYWSLVDYGTSALRLAGVIFILMAISFALVARNRQNFEPTLLAESALQQTKLDEKSVPQQTKWDNDKMPTQKSWAFGERVWMTLRFHVPLVGAIISEEWQPADRPLTITGLSEPDEKNVIPAWWTRNLGDRRWPRARDWYGLMLWMNWILWPLFLPFLIHTLSRER